MTMNTNRPLEDIRSNTVNECLMCTKGSKDCCICVWKK